MIDDVLLDDANAPAAQEASGEDPLVTDTDVLTDPVWPTLVRGRDVSLFDSPRWLSLLQEVYGFSFRARVLWRAGQAVAAVGYSRIEDPRGERIVSLPFCDLNDPIGDDPADWRVLTEDLFDDRVPAVFRTRGHVGLLADNRFESAEVGVWHELDARPAPDDLMAGFATLPRRMIRRAPRDGLVTEASTSRADVRAFFELHVHVRKYRHQLLAQPYALFEAIAAHYLERGDGAVVLARVDGEVVGGCLVLVEGDTAFYKFSASHPDFRKSGVSHITLFEGLRFAHERGLRAFDLGRSDLDAPGLVDFKRRFRPTEQALYVHRRTPDGRTPDDLGPTLGQLTELLVSPDVPDHITEAAGGLLYRYFA